MLYSHDDDTWAYIGSEIQDVVADVPEPNKDLRRARHFVRFGEARHFGTSCFEYVVAVVEWQLGEFGHDVHDRYPSTIVGGERGGIRQGVRRSGGVDRAKDFEYLAADEIAIRYLRADSQQRRSNRAEDL